MKKRVKAGKKPRPKATAPRTSFEKYEGIGNPGIGKGEKAIQKWLLESRGDIFVEDCRKQPRTTRRRIFE